MKNKQKERFRDKRTGTSGAYIPVPCHMHVLLQDTAGHAVTLCALVMQLQFNLRRQDSKRSVTFFREH